MYRFNANPKNIVCINWQTYSKMHIEMQKAKNHQGNFEEEKQLENFHYQYQYLL